MNVGESKAASTVSAGKPGRVARFFGRLVNRAPSGVEALLDRHIPVKVLRQEILDFRGPMGDPKVARRQLKLALARLEKIQDRFAKNGIPMGDRQWFEHAVSFITGLEFDLKALAKNPDGAEDWVRSLRTENLHGLFDAPTGIPQESGMIDNFILHGIVWRLVRPHKDDTRNALQVAFDAIDPKSAHDFFEAIAPFGELRYVTAAPAAMPAPEQPAQK